MIKGNFEEKFAFELSFSSCKYFEDVSSLSCFYAWTLTTILCNWFFFYNFIIIYTYTSNLFTLFAKNFWILAVPLNILTVSFKICYNILFLAFLTSHAFPIRLILIIGFTVFFLSTPFWTNIFEDLKTEMHPFCMFVCLFVCLFVCFAPWLLT